jgi:hypothetical protein
LNVAADFDRWLANQFAASGPFTALLILVRVEGTAVSPLGSSYATVIGSELPWPDMRSLLDCSKLPWTGAAIFPAFSEAAGPLSEESARRRLAELEQRVIADHAVINDGFFFDRRGRMMRLEEVAR